MAMAGNPTAQTAKQHHVMHNCLSNVISAASNNAIAALKVLQTHFCLVMPDVCNKSGRPWCCFRCECSPDLAHMSGHSSFKDNMTLHAAVALQGQNNW